MRDFRQSTRYQAILQLLARVGGFSSLALLGSISPLIVLPLIAKHAGSGAWVALGVGQAVGTVGAAVVALGWNLMGQSEVALARGAEKAHVYARSIVVRLPVACAALPVTALVAVGLVTQDRVLAGAMALAAAAGGLSAGWYFVGSGQPLRMLVFESGPKLLGAMFSAFAIVAGANAIIYPVLLLLFQSMALAWFSAQMLDWGLVKGLATAANWLAELKRSWQGSATALLGTAISALPVPLAARLGDLSEASSLISADRLYRYMLLGTIALSNALQAWVVVQGRVSQTRSRIAVLQHVGFGLAGAAVLIGFGPGLTAMLFSSEVMAHPSLLVAYGFAFVAINVQTPLSRIYAGLARRWDDVFRATLVGIALGLPAMVLLGQLMGPAGVATGFAVLEVSGAVALAALVISVSLRKRSVRYENRVS